MVKAFACASGLCAAVLACAGGLMAAAPDAKPADKDAPAGQDFVYFGDARPVLIRVHAEADGRPLEAAWNDLIDRVFAYADANGDGVLSRDELERAPSPQTLFNAGPGLGRRPFAPPGAAPAPDAPAGKMDRDKFAAYFRSAGGAPFQLQMGATQGPILVNPGGAVIRGGFPAANVSADAVNDALFALLDTDKDGKLSREELAAAPEILMRLDADEDETVSLSELLGQPAQPAGPYVVRATPPMPAPAADEGPFMIVSGADSPDLARQLLKRYGANGQAGRDKTLTRQDLGLDQRAFDRLDADGDGKLDFEELARFTRRPADVELKVHLGRRPFDQPAVEVVKDEKDPPPLAAAVKEFDAGVRLELGNVRLVLRGVEEPRAPTADLLRQQYLAQFKAADQDGNGYLDENEAMRSPFFRNAFKAMDRDGDGKLFEKEVVAWLDAMKGLQDAAAAGVATATFADDSRGLFDLIDLNHDGRLSLRELRQAVKLIDQLDKDGDGKIARSEITKSYQVTFRQGPSGAAGFNGGVVIARPFGVTPPPPAPEPTAGPAWFRKMDRNHDGDVSRKEFLGADEEFKRLDLDGDGLISLDEATKADAALRKGKE